MSISFSFGISIWSCLSPLNEQKWICTLHQMYFKKWHFYIRIQLEFFFIFAQKVNWVSQWRKISQGKNGYLFLRKIEIPFLCHFSPWSSRQFFCNNIAVSSTRDGQVHIFRELDHSRSLPKKSEPRSLTFMNFYLVKIWATFTHDHSRSLGRSP